MRKAHGARDGANEETGDRPGAASTRARIPTPAVDQAQLPATAFTRITRRRGAEPVDEVGIPYRVHYWLLAVFAFGIGLSTLVFSFTEIGDDLASPFVRAICVTGILLAPAIVLAARAQRYRFDARIFHGAMLYATIAPFACQQVMVESRAQYQILFVVGAIGAAFYLPLRQAVPHITLSVAVLLTMGATIHDDESVLRSLIVATFVVCSSLMISAVRRQLKFTVKLNHTLAECDGLTGAFNLRSFERRLAHEIARAQRGGGGFALIEFDLNSFKQVNDRYDHSTGDEVLVATADAIRSAFGGADMLVRRGGDEFVVIAPGGPDRDLNEPIRKACKRVAWARHQICDDVDPTIRCATTRFQPGDTAEDVYRRADEALHDAKPPAGGSGEPDVSPRSAVVLPCPTPDTDEVRELRERRVDGAELSSDPIIGARRVIWKTTAAAILTIAVAVDACALLGLSNLAFSLRSIGISLFWVVVFAPVVWRMASRREQPEHLLHLLAVAALGMITFGCIVAGSSAPALVESYLLVVLAVAAILSVRAAISYMAAATVLYATILFANDYPLATIQLVNTVLLIGLSAWLLAYTRGRTIVAAREKLQLAHTDALTGLPNPRRLSERLTAEIRRSKSTGQPLAMLMLDLDHFKLVNDLFSHSVGDEVLLAVTDALLRTARRTDMPARRGGDEFAVVLSDSDARDATTARDRVAAAIASARARVCPEITPTASVGWVVWREGESTEDFLARADAALNLEKKARRRDRTLVY
ncbi:MAG: GGDEF domain-containing protein [Actinobacteria bacterium]|nr:GGDEF domain-containing protein [Actinomycetota bacterium]